MASYRVGVFEHPGPRRIRLRSYVREYSTQWPGCCEHTVEADTGREAKRRAEDEHRSRCLEQPCDDRLVRR